MRWLNTDIVCQLNCGINDSSIRQRDIEEMLDLQEKNLIYYQLLQTIIPDKM